MRLTIFTKLFLIYTVFVVIPIIISASFILWGYGDTLEKFFLEKIEIPNFLNEELFLILASLKVQIIYFVIVIIFLSLLGSFLASQRIINPLKKIIKGIKEVSSGNLNFVIDIKSGDELGESVKYFNQMTGQLKKAKLVLEESKDTLELKVVAKTKDLEKLVKEREETIQQRTKELQERVSDLERIQKLSVGRELKMAELKKEISELNLKLMKKATL